MRDYRKIETKKKEKIGDKENMEGELERRKKERKGKGENNRKEEK